jgi:hypothetical protein
MDQRDFDRLARDAETPRQRRNRERRERRQLALFREQLCSMLQLDGWMWDAVNHKWRRV